MSEAGPGDEVILAGDQGTMRPKPMYERAEPLIVALLTIRRSAPEGETGDCVDHSIVWGAEMELNGIVADLKHPYSDYAAEWVPVALERPDELRQRVAWVFEG